MDNKRLITAMLLMVVVMLAWFGLNSWIAKKYPQANNPPASQPATAPGPEAATQGTTPVQPAAATQPAGQWQVAPVGEPAPATIGVSDFDPAGKQAYPMAMQINPQGASLDWVVLNQFREKIGEDRPYRYQLPYSTSVPSLDRAMATQSITIGEQTVELWKAQWGLESKTDFSATYAVRLTPASGGQGLILRKHFALRPKTDKAGWGYETLIRYSLENQGGATVKAKLAFSGPNVPWIENNRDIPEIVVGQNHEQDVKVQHTAASGFSPDKGALPATTQHDGPMLWAGVISAYFNGIVHPPTIDGKAANIADVKAQALKAASPEGQPYVALIFQTSDLDAAPGQKAELPLDVYFGPRQRAVLETPYYASFPLQYNKTLVLTGGICGYCTFTWLVDGLVWVLGVFHTFLRDWGLAIIALVLVVRLLLHPVTKRSQISMSRMSKMGPEMERLKKKYGDNKEELNKAMMSFYREQGIAPIMGCLPMILQMPIWIALWNSLQSTFELRQAPFLWGFTWIKDLSQPDHLIKFGQYIHFLFFSFDGLNILPIAMGAIFYMQQKLMPQPAATTPEQEQQQKMMKWMSVLLFPLFLYNGPSGLNLYILTSTAIGIWESKRVRKHIEEQEAREKEGKVIVDAKPTKGSRALHRGEGPQTPQEAPRGCIGGWMANLMAKAQQIQKDTEKKYGKGK